ncbi:hypothetical protein F5I97DRAFT_1964713 [Phlebopus sp. FC_14]|nr:hypothetical protein F5I97DRAFT_1964713 [Phlebopus sp. FC_14]
MRAIASNVVGANDLLESNDPLLDHHSASHTSDAGIHDLNIHVPHFANNIAASIPVSITIHPNVYYSSFHDNSPCNSFSDNNLGSYPYTLQDHDPDLSDAHLDFNYILGSEMHNQQNTFQSPNSDPKPYHSTQDLSPPCPSTDHDSQFHSSPSSTSSLSYAHALHDLSRSPDNIATPFTAIPSSSSKHSGHAHTMLPPIVQSDPAGAARAELDNRSLNKRINGGPSQVDPYASAFLRDQLGEEKWNTFSARLFERRLGPVKSKMRVRGKNVNDDASSAPGATAIDFLVKVEVVKEVLRTYVPHPYNPLKSLSHPYSGSPSGSVTLTRSTILVLSGWSNTQFSYWARRAEGISVLAVQDDRLRAVAVALDKRLRDGGVLADAVEDGETYGKHSESCPNVTGKGLDIIIEEVKKRTGLSPFLRGKHSSLDPFGSTNSDKDAGPGPPRSAPAAPVYMPTFQAMEYSHCPTITAAESPMTRRPKKKRRISLADSVSSYGSPSALTSERADVGEGTPGRFSLMLSENRLTPDQESVSSSDMQPVSPPSVIALPQLLMRPSGLGIVDSSLSPFELSSQGSFLGNGSDDGRPEYFPVSNSRSDVELSDSENFSRKRRCGLADNSLEKRPKLSA